MSTDISRITDPEDFAFAMLEQFNRFRSGTPQSGSVVPFPVRRSDSRIYTPWGAKIDHDRNAAQTFWNSRVVTPVARPS